MKIINIVVLLSLFVSSCGICETIDTGVFSISLPSEMNVTWNETNTILATNKSNPYAPPFIQIQYGVLEEKTNRLYVEQLANIEKEYQEVTKSKMSKYDTVIGYKSENLNGEIVDNFAAVIKSRTHLILLNYLCHDTGHNCKTYFEEMMTQLTVVPHKK